MIYFIEGKDTEINAAFNDLRAALPYDTKQVSLKTDDISNCDNYVVAEISDVEECIRYGISPNRIVGIGYSSSSYIDSPNINDLHRHYTTSQQYHPDAIELPFGGYSSNSIKEIKRPHTIGIVSDFTPAPLKDIDLYEYLHNPQCHDAKYDILVYASNDDRCSRAIRHAIVSGIPIIGYTSIPLIAELVEQGLAFGLNENDDFENALTNTIYYIDSNIQWQLTNSVALFKYASEVMNWDRWIYELERL
jgi:hypothetical protein